jgi:hypothetical protein
LWCASGSTIPKIAAALPAGSTGDAAIFTEHDRA